MQIKTIILTVLIQISVLQIINAGMLRDSISLYEERPGEEIRNLPRNVQNLRVDINSTIHVNLSSSVLNSSQLFLESTRKDGTIDIQAKNIRDMIEGINIWAKGLAQGWEFAQKLSSTQQGTEEYKALKKEANKNYRFFYDGYYQYEAKLQEIPNGKERAVALHAELDAALGQPPSISLPKILDMFNTEVGWLNSQIKDVNRKALENGYALGIKMTASFMQNGARIPLHLPGYDNFASGVPEPYEKLRFEPNEQDKKALSEINAKASELADTIRDTKSFQDKVDAIGKQLLSDNYDQLKKATDELNTSINALRSIDWEGRENKIQAGLQSDLMNLKNESDNEYQVMVSSIVSIVEMEGQISKKLDNISSLTGVVQGNIDKIRELRQHNNASEALLVLLNLVPQNKTAIDNAINSISEIKIPLDEISKLEINLKAKVANLPSEVKSDIEKQFNAAIAPELLQLKKSINEFSDTLNSLKRAKEDMPNTLMAQLSGAGSIEIADVSKASLVPLNSAGETTINIQEAKGREEGDRVQLHVVMYKMKKSSGENDFATDGNPIDEYNAYFELAKYGWYTAPGGGVVFITRMMDTPGLTPIKGQASPVVAWMVHHRGWPGDNQSGYSSGFMDVLRPAIGLHTATLHFDTTKGVELGAGITISIFNDLIQAGFGQDINATDNQNYWYVGFGILKFGNGLGVK